MKHPYTPTCECKRCRREHGRRNAQATADNRQRYSGVWQNRREAAMDRWARRYDALNGAPENDSDR